jgi:hypothetical protein
MGHYWSEMQDNMSKAERERHYGIKDDSPPTVSIATRQALGKIASNHERIASMYRWAAFTGEVDLLEMERLMKENNAILKELNNGYLGNPKLADVEEPQD